MPAHAPLPPDVNEYLPKVLKVRGTQGAGHGTEDEERRARGTGRGTRGTGRRTRVAGRWTRGQCVGRLAFFGSACCGLTRLNKTTPGVVLVLSWCCPGVVLALYGAT